jgi:hypothetical protein
MRNSEEVKGLMGVGLWEAGFAAKNISADAIRAPDLTLDYRKFT